MKIHGILETCLYATNLAEAEPFYRSLPGVEFVSREENRHLFFRCGSGMLLIFNPDHTAKNQTQIRGKNIPLHGTKGQGHIAFAINGAEVRLWKDYLDNCSIEIESEVTWANGAVSVYFRDPAGNSLELVSPGIWNEP